MSQKQSTLALSTAKAEYIALGSAMYTQEAHQLTIIVSKQYFQKLNYGFLFIIRKLWSSSFQTYSASLVSTMKL